MVFWIVVGFLNAVFCLFNLLCFVYLGQGAGNLTMAILNFIAAVICFLAANQKG